jgi:competence protein ComFB
MVVHNVMEEVVSGRIHALFENVKEVGPLWFTCDCEDCRLDTITYVLNRISPKYVVSGRGLNYNLSYTSSQLNVDIDALGMEGLRNISAIKRPYHGQSSIARRKKETTEPVYNFPVIIGAVYDGRTFDPLSGAKLTLKIDNELAEMCDLSWANPCVTYESTKGNFSFWVKHQEAKKPEDNKTFSFVLETAAEGYDPVSYAFDTNIKSEADIRSELSLVYSHKIPDCYLFPQGYIAEGDK